MGSLKERLQRARKALASFQELAGKSRRSAVERDAAIKRFELAFETAWEAAQAEVQRTGRGPAGSPASCIRASREDELLSDKDAEAALAMLNDRNIAVQAYAEPFAKQVDRRLAPHALLLARWLSALEKRAKAS